MSELGNSATLLLPPTIITKVDVARLLVEVELLENELTTRAIQARASGADSPAPVISDQLTDFLSANQIQISDSTQCARLIGLLRQLKQAVPTVHVTFAAIADQASLQQIITWLRQSVHPQAVMVVGLQPALIGGVYIRTTNRVFDFSVRAQLANSRGLLVKELEALSGAS